MLRGIEIEEENPARQKQDKMKPITTGDCSLWRNLNWVGHVQILCQKISPMSCVDFSQMDAVSCYSELQN